MSSVDVTAAPSPPVSRSTRRLDLTLLLILLFGILLRCQYLDLPMAEAHRWREITNADIARNFAERSMNIFYPQVNWGGAHEPYVGMEFPLMHWIAALFYLIFGEHAIIGRLISMAFSVATIWAVFVAWPGFDPVLFGITLTGTWIVLGAYRANLFHLDGGALARAVENALDPVVVAESDGRILYRNLAGAPCGCPALRAELDSGRITPKLHVFGHIHPARGLETRGRTTFVNAAVTNEAQRLCAGAQWVEM